MLCLRCSVLPSALRTLSAAPMASPIARNTLLRNIPTTTPLRSLSTAVRPQLSQPTLSALRAQLPKDIPPSPITQQTRSFSASASLGGKRATYNPSRRVQKRRHGFLARVRTRGGRTVLQRRRMKGRRALSW